MAFAAVISVKRIIEELINSPRISLSPSSKEMMEFAYQQLKSLPQVLKRLDGSSKGDCRKKVNAVDARIKEAVWEFQDLIESHVDNQMLSQSDQILRYDVHLHELRPDVDDFNQKLKKMKEEYIYELDHMMPEEAPDNAVSATTDSDVRKVKLVGSSQILREIKEYFCQKSRSFGAIRIVGMAGIGKTTVCKEIFNDSFELGFDCRAWVTIGRRRTYPVNELERDILVQLDPNMEKRWSHYLQRYLPFRTKKKCSHYLKEILKAKRCLIVLDDVWDTYIWDHLKRYLTVEDKSHVLVTTRLRDVAVNNAVYIMQLYIMQLLNKDESWDLLRERVFGENKCPRELEKYGKKIADKCDGLPLTIVTVANLLSQAPNTAEHWKSVAEDKKSSIFMAAYDQMYEVLFPSYVDNQMLSQSDQILRYDVHLHELRPDVDDFIQKLKKMEEEYIYELDHMMPEEAPDNAVSATTDSDVRKVKLVGSSPILREIKECFQRYWNETIAMMIVGMAGIGKTTVCKEIFNDSFELGHECRAWVTIGRRKYPVNELERDILVQLDPNMEKRLMEEDEKKKCSHYLKEIWMAKRCLIVLDDVWDNYIWDHLKKYLPYGAKSRVLVTTRLRDVAMYIHVSFGLVRTMQLLNKDESWDLLRERVFGENKCPRELEKYGKKIADKCDGLPLTIVTVANLLSQAPNTAEYWKSVAEDKKSSILVAAYDQMYEVLLPSYEYLPQHLKPCFLYMGVFPLNDEISKSNILRLWSAEGFLEPNVFEDFHERSVFQEAYSVGMYLRKLIDNSVAITCQTSNVLLNYQYSVKTCRLQSAFWYLCYREARKSRFFHVLTSVADGVEENMKSQRRLSFHNNILFAIKDVHDSVEDGCASTARSLLCFGPFYPYTVPVCFGLRLLKVLDALRIRFYEFPMQVLQLAHLKYLSSTYNGDLPASISKLWNLQVLIIYRYMSIIKSGGPPSYVPMEIWDMQELKHIRIMGTNLPNPSSNTSLDKLLTLVGVSARTCTKEVLERIPNLRKLGVQIELLPDDDMKSLHCLNHVVVLRKLRSLKCAVVNPKLRSEIVTLPAPLSMFPRSLKKLNLSGLGYPWEYMSIIGSLPGLEVLKLRCYAFRGPKWEVKAGEFWRLDYLLVEGTDLVQFKVESGGFGSELRSLCLKHCYKLEDIQWNGRTSSMKIEVTDCSPSTEKFANKMRSIDPWCEGFVHSSLKDGKLK